MKPKDEELKEIFLFEALEISEQLNRLFTILEKNTSDTASIEAIFRLTHTLKANAAAMGFTAISEISHGLEDIFSLLKTRPGLLTQSLFDELFRANDKLRALIDALKTGTEIPYKGLKTKLSVIERNLRQSEGETTAQPTENQEPIPSPTPDAPSLVFPDVVQVPIRKLDNLLNLIGELVIEKDRLAAQNGGLLSRLSRLTSDLQYSIMDVRLVQVNILFQKFYRIVRDIASNEGKTVDLVLQGTDIEIDRSVLQTLSDSLIHLVRNAISHGIETPQERIAAGKSAAGKLILSAQSDKNSVIISVSDDGRGISPSLIRRKAIEKGFLSKEVADKISDSDIIEVIFESGFSSAERVTNVSGRGVGMDVVRKATQSIGGKVNIETKEGEGTTFYLTVPASMAVKNALLFELKNSTFAIPLAYTEAVINVEKSQIHSVGKGLITTYLDKTITLVFLNDIFDNRTLQYSFEFMAQNTKIPVIVVSFDGRYVGLAVDKLLQQKEVIEKPLRYPLDQSRFISGATIMGDGSVCLMVDVAAIFSFLFKNFKTVQL